MKIKKIDIPQSTAIDASVLWGGINDNVLAAKINELIDVVNELTSCVGRLGVEFTDETHAENVPQPIKLYVCPDGSIYDNEDVAKSHAASMFNPLPAGATTTDRIYLEQELIRTRKALDMAITELKNFSEDKEFSIRTWQLSAKDKLEQIESITKGGNNE